MGKPFCFLNAIYEDSSNKIYELVISTRDFSKIEIARVDLAGLEGYARGGYVKDFNIDNGILKSFDVPILPLNEYVLKTKNELQTIYNVMKSNTLYSLLFDGLQNNFYFVDHVDEKDVFTPFSSIKFSNTTMSVYYPVINDNKLFNRKIVSMKNDMLTFSPIKVAVPKGIDFHYECVKEEIDNYDYDVYTVEVISIYDTSFIPILPLINKAATLSIRLGTVVNIAKTFQSNLYESLGVENEKLEWIGGSGSNQSPGVYFTNSNKKIKKNDIQYALQLMLERKVSDGTYDNFLCNLNRYNLHPDIQVGLRILINNISNKDMTDTLSILQTLMLFYSLNIAYCDMYLYTARSVAYLKHQHLVPQFNFDGSLRPPVIYGSDETYYTVVKEVFPCQM